MLKSKAGGIKLEIKITNPLYMNVMCHDTVAASKDEKKRIIYFY
jgi:hypothetical protein